MSGESTAEIDPESRPESFRFEHRRMPKRAYLIGFGGVVLGLFAGFSIASESIPPAQMPSEAAAPSMKDPTDRSIPGDGVYLVGDTDEKADVEPGLYHARGNWNCSWRRSTDATFEPDDVLASDTSTGDAYVKLLPGDFFDTNGCATWHRETGSRAPT